MRKLGLVAGICAAVLAAPPGAATFILEGQILRGASQGGFQKLDPGQAVVVGMDTIQRDQLLAFDEDQNITLPRAIRVDIGPPDLVIPAGTVVASHYIVYDPAFGARVLGSVVFDAPVLGIATSTRTLAATDFLANTQVLYLSPGLRGLESGDRIWIDPEDPFRVIVDFVASSPGDYVRVFTAQSVGM